MVEVVYSKIYKMNNVGYYKETCDIKKYDPDKRLPVFEKVVTKQLDGKRLKQYYNDTLKSIKITWFVVEVIKNENKVTLKTKLFTKKRLVGKRFFSEEHLINYITYNTKTKNFYHGSITKSKKKIKRSKVRCNVFYLPFLTQMKMNIKRNVFNLHSHNKDFVWQDMITSDYNDGHIGDSVSTESIKIFAQQIFKENKIMFDYNSNYLEGELYKMYLKDNKIKFPDIVTQYAVLGLSKKGLKKHGNVVTYFMEKNNLSGKKCRKLLNQTKFLNFKEMIQIYQVLGVDYFNQIRDDFFIDKDNYLYHAYYNNRSNFHLLDDYDLTNHDKKRIVNLINNDFDISWFLITEHFKMVKDLENLNYSYKIKFTDRKSFDREHYELTDILESYKQGTIKRFYGDNTKDLIEEVIMGMMIDYYPVLLCTTTDYQTESSIQHNCVKTYSERPSSLIISLRENDIHSATRVTIEYQYTKNGINRIQTLGKYNKKLEESWSVPLEILDQRINDLYDKGILQLPKMVKKFKHGEKELQSIFREDSKTMKYIYPVWDNDLDDYFLHENINLRELPF